MAPTDQFVLEEITLGAEDPELLSRQRGLGNGRFKMGFVLSLLLFISGCAPNANPVTQSDGAGFWLGLWHGLILPFSFLISLFYPHVSIYEVANNGGWYNFGFVLGALCYAGALRSTVSKPPNHGERNDEDDDGDDENNDDQWWPIDHIDDV